MWTIAAAMSGLLLLSACGVAPGGGDNGAAGSGKKAALVVAQGGLGDEAYNDLAYQGFKDSAAENGVAGRPIESRDIVAEGEQLVRTAAGADYGLIADLEFSHAEMLGKVAKDFPEVQFAIVNVAVEGPNVTSIVFKEHEGSYLAGVLAALETKDTSNSKINDANRIGFIGGTKSTGIDKFLVGYMEGARSVNPQVEFDIKYADSFGDAAKGQQIAKQMYADGTDIIYTVAGGTGAGVIQAAKDTNHYAIGVDTDQDDIAQGFVLTSVIKRSDLAMSNLVRDFGKGELRGGSTVSYGLKEDGVGLSEMKHTKQDVPADVLAKVEAAKADIISGKVKVWDVTEQGYPSWAK
ncbi:BMP family ABC transporter substrate-binding protein [Amycolatopsis taiwanensis]|uniref:BMP family ABC transporter substrate-binding protein n=2 Tax=Amycolatopsis taiwanensis TaxID=342230 RepID=A0A9W6VGR6_9PSEU|nr:BMP family ABC transporter substrate-binding protein [Amycolatopsis taiwanensis]